MTPGGPERVVAPPRVETDPGVPLSHREILLVLGGLVLGMLVAMGSQSVVGPALPTIVGELGGQDDLPWIMTAQMRATTASTPLWGKLGDLYGRKRLFQLAIVVFLVGSSLSGLSQSIGQLIAARTLQGLGGGGVMSLTMAIMASVVSPRERGRYVGYIASSMMVSGLGGPLLGGFIVDALSWRWCFFVVVPIGLVALVVIQRVLHLPNVRTDHVIDFPGAALLVGAVTATVLVTSFGGRQWAWDSPAIFALGAAAVVLVVLFIAQERRAVEPILPLHLFRSRDISVSLACIFVVGLAMFSATVFLPQYLQITRGASPTRSGLLMTPQMLGMSGTSIVVGRLISRNGRYRTYPIVGMGMIAVSLYLLSMLDAHTAFAFVAVAMFTLGVGMGLCMQVLTLIVQNTVTWSELGVATSTSQFFRSIGGAVGVPVFGAIMNNRISYHLPRLLERAGETGVDARGGRALLGSPAQIHQLEPAVRDAVLDAFARSMHVVFLCAAPLAVIGFVLTLLLDEVPLREDAGPPGDAPVDSDAEAVLVSEGVALPITSVT